MFIFIFACEFESEKNKVKSNKRGNITVDSVDKSKTLIGAWVLIAMGNSISEVVKQASNKELSLNGRPILVLRNDGRFMQWFGDYGDTGDFKSKNDSLFLHTKDEPESYKLYKFTSNELILINHKKFVPVLIYRKLSYDAYVLWKSKFK